MVVLSQSAECHFVVVDGFLRERPTRTVIVTLVGNGYGVEAMLFWRAVEVVAIDIEQ